MSSPRPFGRHEGREVLEATLRSEAAEVRVLNYGCVLRDWRAAVGGTGGEARPVTLGFDRFEDYPLHSKSFGIIAGRVANRIGGARFTLEGREVRLSANDGRNHLHGGETGLGRRLWEMEGDGHRALRLTYASPDGEDGYPGAVEFEVVMRLDGARLTFEMSARPDRPTPVNLAQHSYWNLDGGGDVLGHRLRHAADRWTPVDAELIPTGELREVSGDMDFRVPREMCDADGQPLPLDVNFAFAEGRAPDEPAAELLSGRGDLRLRMWTDQPGVQVYNAPALSLPVPGLGGRPFVPYGGVCLEAQTFPDAVNRPEFPSPIVTPERPYRQVTSLEIAPASAA